MFDCLLPNLEGPRRYHIERHAPSCVNSPCPFMTTIYYSTCQPMAVKLFRVLEMGNFLNLNPGCFHSWCSFATFVVSILGYISIDAHITRKPNVFHIYRVIFSEKGQEPKSNLIKDVISAKMLFLASKTIKLYSIKDAIS